MDQYQKQRKAYGYLCSVIMVIAIFHALGQIMLQTFLKLNQDTFTKKEMSLVIRNVGDIPVKLYSIMPGPTTIPLYKSNGKYDNIVSDYESVPLLYGEASNIKECLYI